MPTRYEQVKEDLIANPRHWVVTGAAGFIGSNLVEALLHLGQHVTGLDNFATGSRDNISDVRQRVGDGLSARFDFAECDILDQQRCRGLCEGADVVLHQAALGSVPRSVKDPVTSTQVNVDGFVRMMLAARDAGVKRFVYASSSSVYGDSPDLPKREDRIGEPLSPYAVTKRVNEMYAHVFSRVYGMSSIGMRYFNVFGPRQNPEGAYAAVIARWILARINGDECTIFGDGETSRDFCYVDNVVQANILAAMAPEAAWNQEFNIAVNDQTSLRELYGIIDEIVNPADRRSQARFEEFRAGDVRHSLADIGKAARLLGYEPQVRVREGLERTVAWYKATRPPRK